MRKLRGYFFLLLAMTAILATAGAALWHEGILQPWLRARIVSMYVYRIAPQLPFQIETVDVDAAWKDFVRGKVSRLTAVVRWGGWRARLDGPLSLQRPPGRAEILARYEPTTTLEPAKKSERRSTPFQLALSAETNLPLSRLEGFGLELDAPAFKWDAVQARATAVHAVLHWGHWDLSPHHENETDDEDRRATLEARAESLSYSPDANHGADASHLVVAAHTLLDLPEGSQPLRVGPEVDFSLNGRSGEWLDGETYVALPLAHLPLEGSLRVRNVAQGISGVESARVTLGVPARGTIRATLEAERANGKLMGLRASAELRDLKLGPWLADATAAGGSSGGAFGPVARALGAFRVKRGTLNVLAHADLAWPPAYRKGSAEVRARDLDASWAPVGLASRGLTVDGSFNDATGLSARIAAPHLYYHRLPARLGATRIEARPLGRAKPGLPPTHFEISARGERGADIPLSVEGVPLKIGASRGEISLAGKGEPVKITTSLDVGPVGPEPFTKGLCLEGRPAARWVPPARASAHFPALEITSTSIDPTGSIDVDLFDGRLHVEDLGLFDLDTKAPEIDFDATYGGIQLQGLGKWAGFGEIDGTLEGYAHDVTIQWPIVTRLDFRYQIKPYHHNVVLFTPQAMKNFITVVAGGENLPGIADWWYFGWPAGLFYGYTVFYTGIEATLEDDRVTLRTLEDEIDPHLRDHVGKRHLVLYGLRIKMPLNSAEYPVRANADTMNVYLKTVLNELKTIQPEPDDAAKENADEARCDPP